jgi:hypothetical protein
MATDTSGWLPRLRMATDDHVFMLAADWRAFTDDRLLFTVGYVWQLLGCN